MSTVLEIEKIMEPDAVGCYISNKWRQWSSFRQPWVTEKEEIQRYIFATDTTKTTNMNLPWSNKTTIPKLCQIRDNLFANYMATMFPKRKNIIWEGDNEEDEKKSDAIEAYMTWVTSRPEFYNEISKLVLDYIDYGNCFVIPEWIDKTSTLDADKVRVGYVGPMIRRICPMDITFDPTSPAFSDAPKVIRSVLTMGEVKEIIERESPGPDKDDMEKLYSYMQMLRKNAAQYPGEMIVQDAIYQISGFTSFRIYLQSNAVEMLTYYGDIYNEETGEFQKNQIVKVVDRHKVLSQKPNPSFFGTAPIYHVGWRIRPDNLWAMGPLDNLVGMQYRVDHLENMKADIWDLTRYPVFKIKGYVEDFVWEPGEKIFIGDDGDVELLAPDTGALQANTEIAILEQKMEEMAGSPKEAMGFRTPGEKTKYEVQRLENAASRIFQNKIGQFEMYLTEQALNAMLELARRNMDQSVIRVFDTEFKVADFQTLTPQDITGNGRVKPMAARHFAEQAQMVQDLNAFFASAAGHDPSVLVHFSSMKLAKMWEDLLDIEEWHIISPYVRISEQADAQHIMQVAHEQAQMNSMTPSGIGNDYDLSAAQEPGASQDAMAQGMSGGPGQGPSVQPGNQLG